jgi:hypothetical protein
MLNRIVFILNQACFQLKSKVLEHLYERKMFKPLRELRFIKAKNLIFLMV